MLEARDFELVQAQGNVRALILELLAELAARAVVEELLAPVEGLALFHLELRQQRRKEHGVGDLGHFDDLAFSGRSLPEEPAGCFSSCPETFISSRVPVPRRLWLET